MARLLGRAFPAAAVHLCAAALVGLVLVAAAQPLFTDDAWWHLALGEVYLAQGLALDADPLLHTAVVPPAPAAWLTDVGLYEAQRLWGFTGLRITHALAVAAFLVVGWLLLRRASASSAYASFATGLVVALSAYRLFQLRPDLFTMLATVALVWLLVSSRERPSWSRLVASAALFVVWANAHAGFVLGLVLLAAALGSVILADLLGLEPRTQTRSRARRLALALCVGTLATLVNPQGIRQHMLYFVAGSETPDLAVVADEWARVDLFAWPVASLPPTPLAWVVVWALLIAALLGAAGMLLRARRHGARALPSGVDPALLGIAAVSLLGMLSAVRLLWLGIFPLLALGQALRGGLLRSGSPRLLLVWAQASLSLALLLAFVRVGDWPMISQAIHPGWYGEPFAAIKYNTSAVWLLRDAGVEGNLFNDYTEGNFLAYWLAPRMGVFVNGSLNVPRGVMAARGAILERRGDPPGTSFESLLDRHRVDVFFGAGLPVASQSARTEPYTATHLERTPGWMLAFRNLRGTLYLRIDDRNAPNLQRLAAYYDRHGVPFDSELGFDPALAIRDARGWSTANGVVPMGFEALEQAGRSLDPARQNAARERMASIFVLLGLYERAERMDRRTLRSDPHASAAARRLVWSLLHQGRYADARLEAERLPSLASPEDSISALLAAVAAATRDATEPERRALVATLPLFTQPEMLRVTSGLAVAETRPPPERGSSGASVRPHDR